MFVLDGGGGGMCVCWRGGHVCMFVCGLGGGGEGMWRGRVTGHVCVWWGGGVCVHVCVYEGADDSPDNCRDSLQYIYMCPSYLWSKRSMQKDVLYLRFSIV